MNSFEKKSTRQGRILVVEDNEQTSEYIKDLLEESGHEPLLCSSGQNALDAIRNAQVDLVLLDIVIPDTNGITIASQMKAISGLDFLPIIIVSALSDEHNKVAALAYADDYITKPFSGEELRARIKSLLRIQRLHRELAQSKNRYQSLYENSPQFNLSLDSDRIITDCNQLFCHALQMKRENVLGTDIFAFVNAQDRPLLKIFLDSVASIGSRVRQRIFPLVVSGSPQPLFVDMKAVYIGEQESGLSVIIAMEDITGRMQLEDEQKFARKQLYRSARLASIGTLASGVAHEMNNPLTAILGFSSALLDRIKNSEPVEHEELAQYLQIINSEALRCRDIVENLSKFAREGEFSAQSVSLPDCINDALKLIGSRASRSGISIDNKVSGNIMVNVNSGKLEQVIVNVLSNCIDFCKSGSTATIFIDERASDSGKFVTLRIADNGPGMAPEILPKVFDPFFTTKEVGRGTGMGLSICYKIMEECSGNIDLISEPGQGTTVVLDIPREQIPFQVTSHE